MAAPVGHSVFADDVRQEVGGKLSVMGIYNGALVFPADTPLPVSIPKIAIITYVIVDRDKIPPFLTVRVLMPPNKTEVTRTEIPVAPEHVFGINDDVTKVVLTTILMAANPIISEYGFIEVMLKVDKKEQRVGRLLISAVGQKEIDTMRPQPSSPPLAKQPTRSPTEPI